MTRRSKPRTSSSRTESSRTASPSPASRRSREWIVNGLIGSVVVLLAIAFFTSSIWLKWFSEPGPQPVADNRDDSPSATPTRDEGVLPADMGRSWKDIDNPLADGWTTEFVASAADTKLKKLGTALTHFLASNEALTDEELAEVVAQDFSSAPLRPAEVQVVLDDEGTQVWRPQIDDAWSPGQAIETSENREQITGIDGMRAALEELLVDLRNAQDVRYKFKTYHIEMGDQDSVTKHYFAISGVTPQGVVEQNATWRITWSGKSEARLKVKRIEVLDFEQVAFSHDQHKMFADCTRSILAANASYQEQIQRGFNYWLKRIQDQRYFFIFANPGLCVGDVNGDGWEDVYLCQEEGLPNRLYLQQPDGTAVDASATWGVDWLHNSRGCLLVDIDNDGDQDLIVAMIGAVIVTSNEGDRFEIRKILPTDDDTMSLSAADYDNDGDLDIHVCVYNPNDSLSMSAEASQQITLSGMRGGVSGGLAVELDAGVNALFRNDISAEGWQFTNVTHETGLDAVAPRLSLAAGWEDYDNDGDLDLYVANDFSPNNLFRNDNGTFVDVAAALHAEDYANGMSVSWSDFDRNGTFDLYVGNMFSAAGNRVTYQDNYLTELPEVKQRLRRWARGSTLLKNLGTDEGFEDISEQAAVTIGRWAWSSNFTDINNDGWDDLVVANGYLTTDDTGDL